MKKEKVANIILSVIIAALYLTLMFIYALNMIKTLRMLLNQKKSKQKPRIKVKFKPSVYENAFKD